MERRSDDVRYMDVTSEGVTITSPIKRLFIPASEIDSVDYSRIRRSLSIGAGKRRIRIRNVVIEAQKTPSKVSLVKWLSADAPSRGEIKTVRKMEVSILKESPIKALQEAVGIIKEFTVD